MHLRQNTVYFTLSLSVLILMLSGCGTQPTTTNHTNNTVTNTPSTSKSSSTSQPQPTSKTLNGKPQWSSPPPMQIDTNRTYDALVHTNYGNFTIELFAKQTPITVNNFVFLAEHHFYNHDQFFRIIKPFMIQTGDPLNNGTGGPGYSFANELPPKYPYGPGMVAMAHSSLPNSNGSQFFICTGSESKMLNQGPDYTEFGKIISGMNVVQKIASIPVTYNPQMQENSKPTKLAYIESIQISVHN